MSNRFRMVGFIAAVLLSVSISRAEQGDLQQRAYAVADLVAVKGNSAKIDTDELVRLIKRTIAPKSWSSRGGRGTIDYHPYTMSLVIKQTPEVQGQIADLLAALQRMGSKSAKTPAVKEKKQTNKAADKKTTICPCGTADYRTPILAQIRANETVVSEQPDETRILRALPRTVRLPGVYEESLDNIQIVTERLVDKVDPPRFYPLVGPARLHHCHWKCTVYYNETIESNYPFTFRRTQPRVQVVYIDLDHLHLAESN